MKNGCTLIKLPNCPNNRGQLSPINPFLDDDAPAPAAPRSAQSPRTIRYDQPYDSAEVTAILTYNGIPFDMGMRLQNTMASVEASSLNEALSDALDTSFNFAPIAMASLKPIVLVGPPGAGKTVTAAKLAAEAAITRRKPLIITFDTVKNTGFEQLEYFAKLMKTHAKEAKSPEELKSLLPAQDNPEKQFTIIDSFGINPFDMKDLQQLLDYIKVANMEPVMVMPAGMDPMEAADMAEVFAQVGAKRLICTRLDTARRYASILLAAQAGQMAIAGLSNSPYVADAIQAPNPRALARLLSNLPSKKKIITGNKRAAQ